MSRKPKLKKKKAKKYSFPLLSVVDIVEFLKEHLGLPITGRDLKAPSEERMKMIYGTVLRQLMAVDLREQTGSEWRKHFEYPQLHERSVEIVFLVRALIRLMTRIGVKDFGIGDLINPENGRTVRNLSAIINWAKFRAEKWKMVEAHNEERKSLMAKLTALRAENARLAEDYKAAVRSKPERESVAKSMDDTKLQMDELVHSSRVCADDCQRNKEQLKALDNEIKVLTVECRNSRDEIESLTSKIVKNPDKIKAELEEKNEALKVKHIQLKRLECKLEQLLRVQSELKKALATVSGSLGRVSELEQTLARVRHFDAQKSALSKDKTQLNKAIGRLKEQCRHWTESHKESQKNHGQYQNVYLETQKEVSTCQAKVDVKAKSIEARRMQHTRQLAEIQAEIEKLQLRKTERKAKFDAQIRELRQQTVALEQCVSTYHSKLDIT